MAFIFKKRNKNKSKRSGSGGKKKSESDKKKKGDSKFPNTRLPVIEEEDEEREQDSDKAGVVNDAAAAVAEDRQDDVFDFGDISQASTDGDGDDFILNSYNTDGTIDGSQLKSDAKNPVVESTLFSQQWPSPSSWWIPDRETATVAAADAVNMLQRISSTMTVTTASIHVGDRLVKSVGGVNAQDTERDRPIDGAKHEDQKEEDAPNESKDKATKDASNDDDVAHEGVDSSGTGITTSAGNKGGIAGEEDGSPFNVCTNLFRF